MGTPRQGPHICYFNLYFAVMASSCRSFPRIKAVRAYVVEAAAGDQGADCHDVDDQHWINGHPVPIANPMSGYSPYQQYRKSWGINALGSLVVEV